jgi:hypothetical protein
VPTNEDEFGGGVATKIDRDLIQTGFGFIIYTDGTLSVSFE